MQGTYWSAELECQNPKCGPPAYRMPLPYPNREEILHHHQNWPLDDWSAFVACPQCGRGNAYFAPDVHWETIHKLSLPLKPTLYRGVFSCDQKGCPFPIVAFSFLLEWEIEDSVRDRLYEATKSLRCKAGHLIDRGHAFGVGTANEI